VSRVHVKKIEKETEGKKDLEREWRGWEWFLLPWAITLSASTTKSLVQHQHILSLVLIFCWNTWGFCRNTWGFCWNTTWGSIFVVGAQISFFLLVMIRSIGNSSFCSTRQTRIFVLSSKELVTNTRSRTMNRGWRRWRILTKPFDDKQERDDEKQKEMKNRIFNCNSNSLGSQGLLFRSLCYLLIESCSTHWTHPVMKEKNRKWKESLE